MSWLFFIIIGFIGFNVFIGGRKGFFKTAISMLFLVLVLILASLLNPYVAQFLRENTPVYETVRNKTEEAMTSYLIKEAEDKFTEEDKAKMEMAGISPKEILGQEIPEDMQATILENLPLPNIFKQNIINNNKIDIYELLGVDKFIDYVASYVAYSITNGIAFLLSFTLAIVIIKVTLYAINILTALPGISLVNSLGGMLLGGAQAILWIWVFFIVVTVICNTSFGNVLMNEIENDMFLSFMYEKNVFLPVVMKIFA